jgi:hypothetical protein
MREVALRANAGRSAMVCGQSRAIVDSALRRLRARE